MSTSEIKIEIQQLIDLMPDESLSGLLDYLKQIQTNSADQKQLSNNLRKILLEDKVLLEKLAQ